MTVDTAAEQTGIRRSDEPRLDGAGRQPLGGSSRQHLLDVGFLCSCMIMLLAVLPSPLVVPNINDLGRPGVLFALGLAGLWLLSRSHPELATRGPQPIRWLAGFFFTAALASYAAGEIRGMPGIEANGAQLALLGTLALCGAMVAMADGVSSRRRLDEVLRVMLLAGGIMAVIGIAQAVLATDITEYIQVPGLQYHGNLNGLEARGVGLFRVASTTGHYIEFGTVMAMLLPLAVHMARYGPSPALRQWSGISGALMFVAVPMTLSRTGIVALAVAVLVMIPAWNWRMRFNLALPVLALLSGLVLVKPGLLGTILGLFGNWGSDASVQGRVSDYDAIGPYLQGHVWFGRGNGTFIPTKYLFLDNQWLQQLVGGGIVGVVALAAVHLGAVVVGLIVYRQAVSAADKHLAVCLISVQLVAIAVGFTFDSLGFSTYALFMATLAGATGALWRFTRRSVAPSAR